LRKVNPSAALSAIQFQTQPEHVMDAVNIPLSINLLVFAVSAGVVWIAGTRLTNLVDELADRMKLARSLMGLLVLSLATSLPEVATTLSAAIQQNRELVLNNLYGGIALQTAILAVADVWARGAITNYPRKANHALEATLLVMLLALTLILLLLKEPLAIGTVGVGSLLVGLAYAGSIWLLRSYDDASDWVPVDIPVTEVGSIPSKLNRTDLPLRSVLWQSAIACTSIFVFGVALVISSGAIAEQSGLGANFIGVTLLAAATSLPEVSTTIAAVRIGAYTLAISNIFGSNLIMLVLVLPADLLFKSGPILRATSATVPLAICFGILVTSVYLVGLIVRRKPKIGAVGLDSAVVAVIFASSLVAYYFVRNW